MDPSFFFIYGKGNCHRLAVAQDYVENHHKLTGK